MTLGVIESGSNTDLGPPYGWRYEMFFGKATKFGVGAAALALVAIAGIGFAPAPTQLPTVTVYHSPT